MTRRSNGSALALVMLLVWVVLLAFFFAQVEIQIEGSAGWAANLPTWRIEKHWLLDVFWGGRPMTGYHAWLLPFVALFFHLPLIFMQQWTWRLEAKVVACFILFWIFEDFLWFVFNPAYGIAQFTPEHVSWHKHWLWCAPVDYWAGSAVAAYFLYLSHNKGAVATAAEK